MVGSPVTLSGGALPPGSVKSPALDGVTTRSSL